MAKTKYLIVPKLSSGSDGVHALIRAGLIAYAEDDNNIIVGRHGTNKTELKKLLKQKAK